MDLTNRETIEVLLERHKTKPTRSLGQNFLIDKNVLLKICSCALISKKDTIVEVGAGLGTLTVCLAKEAYKVIAIEKDAKMISALKETVKNFNNVELVHGDILKLFKSPEKLNIPEKYKVIANLPYCVASQTIKKFLTSECSPSSMVVMVQKEVAERIIAKPPRMNMLAVFIQFYADVEKIIHVGSGSFWPSPKITSAIIKITPFKSKKGYLFEELFFKLLKAGYRHPRKQLATNFIKFDNRGSKGLELKRKNAVSLMHMAGIDPKRRAESLSLEEWIYLTEKFLKND